MTNITAKAHNILSCIKIAQILLEFMRKHTLIH